MLSADLLFQIAVLAMIGLLSLGVAVSARGPVRTTVAYAIFVVNLAIIGAFTLLKLNTLGGSSEEIAIAEEHPTAEVAAPQVELPPPEKALPPKDTTGDIVEIPPVEEPTPPPIDKEPILAKFRSIRSKGLTLAENLENYTIGELKNLSDVEYESLIDEANQLSNRAQSLLREFSKVENRDAVASQDRKMALALNTLNQSARSLRSFFNAENAAEESEFRSNYKRFANQAKSQFSSALN